MAGFSLGLSSDTSAVYLKEGLDPMKTMKNENMLPYRILGPCQRQGLLPPWPPLPQDTQPQQCSGQACSVSSGRTRTRPSAPGSQSNPAAWNKGKNINLSNLMNVHNSFALSTRGNWGHETYFYLFWWIYLCKCKSSNYQIHWKGQGPEGSPI